MSGETIGMILTAVFGGGGIGGYLTYRQAINQQKSERKRLQEEHELALANARAAQSLAAANQPVEHYRQLVEAQSKRIDKLEQDHAGCVEHQLRAEHAMGEMRGQLLVLSDLLRNKVEVVLKDRPTDSAKGKKTVEFDPASTETQKTVKK